MECQYHKCKVCLAAGCKWLQQVGRKVVCSRETMEGLWLKFRVAMIEDCPESSASTEKSAGDDTGIILGAVVGFLLLGLLVGGLLALFIWRKRVMGICWKSNPINRHIELAESSITLINPAFEPQPPESVTPPVKSFLPRRIWTRSQASNV